MSTLTMPTTLIELIHHINTHHVNTIYGKGVQIAIWTLVELIRAKIIGYNRGVTIESIGSSCPTLTMPTLAIVEVYKLPCWL